MRRLGFLVMYTLGRFGGFGLCYSDFVTRLSSGRALGQCAMATTAVKVATKPFVWTPNFLPVEFNDDSTFLEAARFRLVSYNVLAQAYVKSSLFPHTPSACLKWKNRSQQVFSRLCSLDADLLCIQELDEYESFYQPQLETKGYTSIYVQRGGKKRDGCGIFYKQEWCELLQKRFIDYDDLVPENITGTKPSKADEDGDDRDVSDPCIRFRRNCVGVLAAFQFPRAPDCVVVLANTHLYWDPKLQDVKLAQAKYLLARLCEFEAEVSEKFRKKTVVLVAGDFNSTPGDKVYDYLTSGQTAKGLKTGFRISELLNDSGPSGMPLDSLYATVQGEPSFTNYTPDFTGTLDYIFFRPSSNIRPRSFLDLPRLDAPDVMGGLPNHAHPSDHIPIGADFSIS